ncbi:MAG: membrane dipeptidase [Syntrophomonas sp.]
MKIIDLHCDILSKLVEGDFSLYNNPYHFDIKRALQVGQQVQFFSLFTNPDGADACMRKILLQTTRLLKAYKEYPDYIYPLTHSEQLDDQANRGKLAGVIHLEGAEALGGDLELIYLLYELGLRSLALTWNPPNLLAGGVDAPEEKSGLTSLGRELIKMVNQMDIILDLAHIAPRSFFEVIELYNKPLLVTHANTYHLCSHRRNLKDDQLKALAQNGGVIGFTQVSDFVKETGPALPQDFIDHLVYVAELIGVEFVALGSDFDGAEKIVLPSVEAYADMPGLLENRGFSRKEIELILSGNALRLMRRLI